MQAADADLTLAAPPAVLTDAGATAFLAEVALPPMLTDAGTAALPADLAMFSVLADAAAAALPALCAPPAMRTRRGHDDRPNPASDWAVLPQLHLGKPLAAKVVVEAALQARGVKQGKSSFLVFFIE